MLVGADTNEVPARRSALVNQPSQGEKAVRLSLVTVKSADRQELQWFAFGWRWIIIL